MGQAVIPWLLVVIAAPQLTGPADAVGGAAQVFVKAKLDVQGQVKVQAAGRVAAAGVHAAKATVTVGDAKAQAFGFGDDARGAARDAGRRAARKLAGRLLNTAPPAKLPTLDPADGTLVRLEGLRSFAALDGALEFLRKRDSTAVVAMLVQGVPTVRLSGTRSAAGLAAAARDLALPGHALKGARIDGGTVTLSFEPPPPPAPEAEPATGQAAGPAMDDEDAPR